MVDSLFAEGLKCGYIFFHDCFSSSGNKTILEHLANKFELFPHKTGDTGHLFVQLLIFLINADSGLGIVVSEEQCLQQIYIDEQFGDIESRKNEEEKKK